MSGCLAELAAAATPRPNEAPELAVYRSAARALAAADAGERTVRLLDTLLARDALALRLARDPALEPAQAQSLLPLDTAVREGALLLVDGPAGREYCRARDSLAPGSQRWWWLLDAEAEARHQFWTLLTQLALLAAVVLALDLLLRFWGNAGAVFTLFSFLLTLAAATPLTVWGRRQVDRLLDRRGLAPAQKRRRLAAGALLTLTLVILLRIWLPPAVARYANARGFCFYARGALPQAIANFERSMALDPTFATAPYNLGAAYEDSLDYARARTHYLRAYLVDPTYGEAVNNLSRLLLVQGDSATDGPSLAAAHLERAATRIDLPTAATGRTSPFACLFPTVATAPRAPDLRYRLLTNRAWALLLLGHAQQALDLLDQAIELNPIGAAAHCVQAQALEAQGGDAAAAWNVCYRNPDGDRYLQPDWIISAGERHDAQK